MTRNNDYQRMSQDENFILMCFLISKRSHDAQTQCGAVFVRDGSIISTGYNGFLRGATDESLPNTRPNKYKWIIHSEANAIYNAARIGVSLVGASAYITGQPCPECLKSMIQSGIKEVVYTDKNNHSSANEEKSFLDELIRQHNVKVRVIDITQEKIDLIRSL